MKINPRTILAAPLATLAFAQDPSVEEPTPSNAETLAPLIVTGDLWQSELSRIPASVTIFDERALDSPVIQHFGDLIERVPNLTFTGGTSRPRAFQIRGLGENSQFEGENPDFAVRFLIDDIDFTGIASVASTFDTRQVEILRGPQAGSFGVNASGGLIRMVSNDPTPYWNGRYELSAGDDSLFATGLALGGPLIKDDPERLMFRASVFHNQADGFRKNVFLNDHTNARDEWSSRLRFIWNQSPDLKVAATFFHADFNNGFDEFALDNNGRRTFSNEPGRDVQRSTGGSIRTTYSGWNHVKLTSITTGTWTDALYSYDEDWTSASYNGFSELDRDRYTLSEEIRLDSTEGAPRAFGIIDRWTVGAYAGLINESGTYTRRTPRLITDFQAVNYAAFTQAGHDLSERDRLILGLRVEHVRADSDALVPARGGRPALGYQTDFSDTLIGGKLTYERDIHENFLSFASIASGYQAGGLNMDARQIDPASDPLNFDSERIWNFETGMRSHWFDHRLGASITAFHMERRNTQVRDNAGSGGDFRFFQGNGDRAHVSGLEFESNLQANDSLRFYGNMALMTSRIAPFVRSNGTTGGGRELANTPLHGWAIGVAYNHESGGFATIDIAGRADYFESNNHDEKRDAFTTVNTAIGYSYNDWTFTLWARNLLNERFAQRVFFFDNEGPFDGSNDRRFESLAPPRQIGVTLSREF